MVLHYCYMWEYVGRIPDFILKNLDWLFHFGYMFTDWSFYGLPSVILGKVLTTRMTAVPMIF